MIKKIEVFYKEDECFIKDNFDENLKVTKAEKIMIDKINELIDKIFIYKNNETEINIENFKELGNYYGKAYKNLIEGFKNGFMD